MLLFLMMFSASCAEKPLVIEKPVPVAPPAQYYAQDCPETFVALLVNKDLAEKINALRADLGRCNADRAAIRSWKEELQD